MHNHRGISIDNWAIIEGDCHISGEVVDDRAQVELGVSHSSVNLILSETGLRNLITTTTELLQEMRFRRTE
jgi:hypothetical protein